MEKTLIQLPAMRLLGITVRTNNANEMDPEKAQIGRSLQKYFTQGFAEKIKNRKNPGTTFCVYTNYESDFTGDYTYFIGEEVSAFNDDFEDLKTLLIPPQNYAKFTNQAGPMPKVVIDMWQSIWQMKPQDLSANRAYIADFEVYDEKSTDPQNTVLDLYIGLEK